jgi:coenzyme F420-reducing hydrogenase alpha subunit
MKTIKVDYLARVEGEGALRIRFKGDQVRDVELRIFEPPRFFEAFLRGRSYLEAPDITARICGICPVAYQMSSCAAMEDAVGAAVTGAPTCGVSSTAANGSKVTRCTFSCCTRRTFSAIRMR